MILFVVGQAQGIPKKRGERVPGATLRPCRVWDEHYEVYAIMGDRHLNKDRYVIMWRSWCSPCRFFLFFLFSLLALGK